MENYYKTLGLNDFCTDQEKIKNAYRQQVKFFHPDSDNVSKEMADLKTKELNAAYDVLCDPQKKQIYDSQLRYERGEMPRQNYEYCSNYSNNTSSSGTNHSNYRTNSTYNRQTYSNTNSGSNTNNNSGYTYRPNSYARPNRRSTGIGKPIAFAVVALLVLVMCTSTGTPSKNSTPTNTNSNSNKPSTTTDPDANLTPVSITNGKILKYPSDERIAPFSVETSGTNGYYIYLKDISNAGKNDMAFYVSGGKTVEVDVPLGNYYLYYCTGATWYGTTHKFGANTYYCKADTTMNFYVSGDYVYGHTVTLNTVANGNMETESIDESQFPG